jgi:peptidyl-prolyl cis-trans isomerase B (cyclophilin B)
MKKVLVVLGLIMFCGAGCVPANDTQITYIYPDDMSEPKNTEWTFPGVLLSEQIANKQVRIATKKGEIVFELFADTAPKTVSNFVYLAQGGYYNGLTFHRRVEGFVIQGGDPEGNGTGGPGYKFEDELNDEYKYDRGVVAMANSGPNTNGSQFFIMLADYPLQKDYTIFGRVTQGMEVVDKIAVGEEMTKVVIETK